MLKIPKVFYADRRSAGAPTDANITDQASRLLRRVAGDLHLRADDHEIVATPARSGCGCKVTLRTHSLMLEVADSPSRERVSMSFRTRRGRTDLSGGGENAVPLEQVSTRDGYNALLGDLRLASGLDANTGSEAVHEAGRCNGEVPVGHGNHRNGVPIRSSNTPSTFPHDSQRFCANSA